VNVGQITSNRRLSASAKFDNDDDCNFLKVLVHHCLT